MRMLLTIAIVGKLAIQYSGFRVFALAKRSKPSRSSTISATSKMLDPDPRWNSTPLLFSLDSSLYSSEEDTPMHSIGRHPIVSGGKDMLLLKDVNRQPVVTGKKDVLLLEDVNRQPTVTGRKDVPLLEDAMRQPTVTGRKDVPLLEDVNRQLAVTSRKDVLLLEDLDLSSSSGRGYFTMGSMVSSSFDRENVTDVMVVKNKEHSGARILEFGSNSGAVDHQRQLSPSSNVVKMHLIATKLKFLPGGMKESLRQVGRDHELALKYGEDLENPEVCNDLAKEIKRLQDEAAPGSKFVICSALGTSAKQHQLEKQGRPNFAKNRASNMRRHLQVALQAVGAKQTFPDPIVKYRKDRVAALLMKSYIGAEPACNEDEIRIPHLRSHSSRHAPRATDRASIDHVVSDEISHEEVTGSGTILEEIGNLEVTDRGRVQFKDLSRAERKTKLRKLQLKYHPDKVAESATPGPIYLFAQEWWDCEFKESKSTKEAWAELQDGVYKVFCE